MYPVGGTTLQTLEQGLKSESDGGAWSRVE